MYIAPLAELIRSFGVRYHQYADDTQLYIAISRDNVGMNLEKLERCIASVHEWLLHNGLALNPSKSEAIQFKTGRGGKQVDNVATINVSGVAVQTAETVKSLGVILDRQLSFSQHVDNVCRACYFHIRALRHVRDSLPEDVAKTVAVSIVTSRLDYCNSLYFVWYVIRQFRQVAASAEHTGSCCLEAEKVRSHNAITDPSTLATNPSACNI